MDETTWFSVSFEIKFEGERYTLKNIDNFCILNFHNMPFSPSQTSENPMPTALEIYAKTYFFSKSKSSERIP